MMSVMIVKYSNTLDIYMMMPMMAARGVPME